MFKKLFGARRGDTRNKETAIKGVETEYKGYTIIAAPESVSGQFRVSGLIKRESATGEIETHRFERSDTLPDKDGCIELTQMKAERFIDDVGEEMFP